jgi:hypothetical protein
MITPVVSGEAMDAIRQLRMSQIVFGNGLRVMHHGGEDSEPNGSEVFNEAELRQSIAETPEESY